MTYFMSVIRFWVGLGFVQCFTGLPVSNPQCLKTTKKSLISYLKAKITFILFFK